MTHVAASRKQGAPLSRSRVKNRPLRSRWMPSAIAAATCVLCAWQTAGADDVRRASSPRVSGGPVVSSLPPGRIDRTLELQGIRFRVRSANDSSINQLEITPSGLEIDNRPIVREIDGTVTGVEVADLDANGSPEIYVYIASAGSGSYGSVVAYAANRRKSLSEAYMPPITDHPTASRGYMGHDQFAIVAGTLVRRFPVYRPGDTNAAPSGGTRQVHYQLVPGEANWQLRIDRVVDD